MDASAMSEIFLLGAFRLDRRSGGLFRRDDDGADAPVTIGSRALDILGALIARAGEVVSKDEIIAAVWPGTVVEDSNLTVQISALRRVLDRGRTQGSCIQRVSGRGYRFVGAVTREGRGPPPRLSIVVLPFTNLSEDREQQYFADAITEDLTTNLSQIANMFVISSNTAFTYRYKPVGTRQIGRELGVRYVLEGSVQRSGSHVRVNTQLIDAETDAHVWTARFARDTSDLFALQNEIPSRVAVALNLELIAIEAARPTRSLDGFDYVLRGRAAMNKPRSRDTYAEAISQFEHALALDPGSADVQGLLARVLVARLLDFGSSTYDSDLKRAEELSIRALAAAPCSPVAHFARGQVLRVLGRLEEAISEYETVLASDPNCVDAAANIGRCKIYIGPIEEAISAQEQAIRLSPGDPQIGFWYFRIGQAHLLLSRIEEAILWFEKARSVGPGIPHFHAYLASSYALKGDAESAASALAEAQRLDDEGSYSSIARLKLLHSVTQIRGARPEIRALFDATYFAGLRKAGMPEE